MRTSSLSLIFLLGMAALAAGPSSAQQSRPTDDEAVMLRRPEPDDVRSRASRLGTSATGDTFFIGHVTSGGQLPWQVGRGPYRPGVSREGVWDFEWSAGDPDSLQGWVPVVQPNDRTLGTIADDLRPWMALDYGNRMNAAPVQGHTYGIVSAWHVDRGRDVPDAANPAATPLWSPLAGTASAWCGLRSADDRSYLDDAARGGTGNPINGDALLGRRWDGTTETNFPGYANQWDQMLYRDVRVASGGALTVSFKYQTWLDVGLDNTTTRCTGWFDKDPLNVTSGNFVSSTTAGRIQPVDSFMVYVGVPAMPAATTHSDGVVRPIFDLKRRWFSEVIAVEQPYKEILTTSGLDSAYRSTARVFTVANAVLQPMLSAQGAADGGGVIRIVFRVKTNKDISDESGTGGTFQSYGYGAVRIDDVGITGCATPVTSGFETPGEIDNTIEGPDASAPGPAVAQGYALQYWKGTGKPPRMMFHNHPLLGGPIGSGDSYSALSYADLCGPPGSPIRLCNLDGVVVSMGDHDDGERAGSHGVLAFHETRQGMLSPTINLVTPDVGLNSCGLDRAHVEATDDWLLSYDIQAEIFNSASTGNVWMAGLQCYPVLQANGSKVWGQVKLPSSAWSDPRSICTSYYDPIKPLIHTSKPNGIPDSIRIFLGREQRCISFGVTDGCSPICGASYDNVALAFPPPLVGQPDRLQVDIWDWYNDAFPRNETVGLPGTTAFDTCGALIKTGRNTAPMTGNTVRFDVPGDSVIVHESNADGTPSRVDMVFRILPGPGNYMIVGDKATALRRVPSVAVAVAPGDNSFWGQYMATPGEFSKGNHISGWNVDTWNSVRCDTVETNIFPAFENHANLPNIAAGRWMSTIHEEDPRLGTVALPNRLGILKNRCFLIDPAAGQPVDETNITCNSVPAWVTADPGKTGYDGNQQTLEYTKVFPDGLLTAGSHVQYFFRGSKIATPTQFVMVPDTNSIYPQPDEGPDYDGHRWQQFGVLPDRWKEVAYGGLGSACLLVLDYDDRGGSERAFVSLADSIGMTFRMKYGAHNGWHASAAYIAPDGSHDYTGQAVGGDPTIAVWKHGGQPGTVWDFYQVKGVESATMSSGGIGSRLASRSGMGLLAGKQSMQGPTPDMLRAYYRDILLLSGDLNANILGPVPNNGSNDVGILQDFLSNGAGPLDPRGLWAMGSGFVESETAAGGAHLSFLTDNLATFLRDPSYYSLSGAAVLDPDLLPTTVIAPGGMRYGIRNSCASSNDVLEVNTGVPGATVASHYENLGGNGPYVAGVYAPSSPSHPYVTLVDGFDLKNLRSSGGHDTAGRLGYFMDVLVNAFGSVCAFMPPPFMDAPQNTAGPVDFLGNVRGNPMVGGRGATVHFGLASGDRVEAGVFDLAGRRVRTLADRNFPPGEHTLVWDGADEQGRALPRGVYFTRVDFVGRHFQGARKIVLLR